jgi:hypothetical protein
VRDRRGVDFRDLQQALGALRIHARQHPVEALRVPRVHEDVQPQLLRVLAHSAQYFEVAEMRDDQHAAAICFDRPIEARIDFAANFVELDTTRPDQRLVEQRIGKVTHMSCGRAPCAPPANVAG